ALFVGGKFSTAGGISSQGIARWDGANWSSIGGVTGDVRALAVSGTSVYIGGAFDTAGGGSASNIARWDNGTNAWSALGSGRDGPVETIAAAPGSIYVGGQFNSAGGISRTSRLARYTFNPIPQITSISPNPLRNDQDFVVTITGSNFTDDPKVLSNANSDYQ